MADSMLDRCCSCEVREESSEIEADEPMVVVIWLDPAHVVSWSGRLIQLGAGVP